jgi:hypothetical protein
MQSTPTRLQSHDVTGGERIAFEHAAPPVDVGLGEGGDDLTEDEAFTVDCVLD